MYVEHYLLDNEACSSGDGSGDNCNNDDHNTELC